MKNYLIIYLILLNFSGSNLWSQQTGIKLDLRNQSLKDLIHEVESQSNFYFIYRDEIFKANLKLNIKSENSTVEEILQKVEEQIPLKFDIIGHQIIIKINSDANGKDLSVKRYVSGKVTNRAGQSLVGVSIMIKGRMSGTLTNENGDFKIEVPEGSTTLVFSYIGMTKQEITVQNETDISVILEEEIILVEEVISIGYGTIRRNENTGSIATLKSQKLNEFPITSLEQGLKGKLTGIQITPSSGQPGSGMGVRIRGVSSIAGGNEPLYVVDGIPIFNSDVRELNGLSGISPGDIGSIDVLKDAIATSIYGSRAANGVILITTKNGMPGRMKITYNSFLSLQKINKKLALMGGEEYINYVTEYYTSARNISEEQKQENLDAVINYGNAETDWQDEVYRKALHQGHKLSFSGGNENNLYFASLNYTNQNGIVNNTNLKNYGFRVNLKNNVTNWLNFSSRALFSNIIQNGFLAGDGSNTRNSEKSGIGATILIPSTISAYDANGNFSPISVYPFSLEDIDNPIAMLHSLDKKTMYYFIGGFDVKATIFPGIANILRFGGEFSNRTQDYYIPKNLLQLGAQTAELKESKRVNNIIENFLHIQKAFPNQFNIETVIGFSAQKETYQNISLAGAVFPSDNLQNSVIQSASSISTPQTHKTATTLASFFSRIHLNYLNRYHFSVSVRYDGSSVFSENDKWGTFPALAFAWQISQENFLKNTFISNLKLRTSWGLSGNQAINPYQSLNIGEIVNTPQGAGNGVNVGLASNLPNNDLTWETTEQVNFGLDFGTKIKRLKIIVDYYIRNTKNLLANVNLPGSAGYNYFVDNVGAVRNHGYELTIGTNLLNEDDWLVSIDLNYSKNINIVKSTKNNQDIILTKTDDASRTSTVVRVGEPLFSFYLPKFKGFTADGKPIYEDLDNDGIIDENDNQIIGSHLPDYFYGIDVFIKYKRLSMSISMHGLNGAKLNNIPLRMLTEPEPTANRIKNIRDYYPVLNDDFLVKNSDRFIEDASYLRLKNVKLAYKIPNISRNIGELIVYLSGQNLLTFTKYSGYEPEVNSFSNNNQLQGVDYAAYPSAKAFTMGINLSF